MRRRGKLVAIAVVAALPMLAVLKAQQARPETALRAAIEQETVKGDLKGAIAAYQRIADSASQSREVRAEALVRMGTCHQKLGDAQAKQIFEKVIRDFGDQTALATRARTALRELGGVPSDGELTIRRLGVLPDVANAISDSGQLAAGTDWDTGNIVVWDVATGKAHPVTDQHVASRGQYDENGEEPIFSPDATKVAYTWCAVVKPATATTKSECDGQLRLSRIRQDGVDPPRTLFKQSRWTRPYAWSPDGSTIAAFASVDPGFLSKLLLISTSTGKATKLDTFARTDHGDRAAFSPDGKYLVVSVTLPAKGQADVFVYDVSAAKRLPIATTAANEQLVGWTPDGRHVLFSSEARGSYDLYEIGFTHGIVQGPPRLLRADLGTADPLSVSSSGTLYYSKQSGRVWTMHFATIDFEHGTLNAIPDPPRPIAGYAPLWTRDGALVYLSRPNVLRGSRTTLKVNANGTTREIVSQLVWSTNGNTTSDANTLLIEGTNGMGEAGLYQVDLASGKTVLLAEGARHSFASQDGRRVYYFRGEGAQHDLIEHDLSSGRERTLLSYQHSGNIPESAYVSPDGARVYYRLPDADAKTPEPQSRVIERDVASGQERELFNGRLGGLRPSGDGRFAAILEDDPAGKWTAMRLLSLTDTQPPKDLMRIEQESGLYYAGWSPDSRSVLLQTARGGQHTSWWVPIAGGAPKQLAAFVGSPAISPDGKTIAFSVADNAPLQFEIWSMNDFLKRP